MTFSVISGYHYIPCSYNVGFTGHNDYKRLPLEKTGNGSMKSFASTLCAFTI